MKIDKLNKSIAKQILNSDKMSFCLVGATGTGKSEIINIIHKKRNIKSLKFDYHQYEEWGLDRYKEEILNCMKSILKKKIYINAY